MLQRLRRTWRTSSAIFGSALLFLAAALPAHASAYQSFFADVEVRPDGSFVVTETIDGAFAAERHGIYRAVPLRYENENGTTKTIGLDVVSVTRDGESEPFTTFSEGSFETVKIGADEVTFSGPFSYEIVYRVEDAVLFHESADEVYWNVAGDQWDEPIGSVGARVRVAGVAADAFSVSCYTGAYGSAAQDCVWDAVDGEVVAQANEFLTVSVSFPKGFVREPSVSERTTGWLSDNWDAFVLFAPLLALGVLLRRWWKFGRDAKGRGTIVAQFDPPDGLRPTLMGTLVDATVHDRDVSAGIVDLAVRGYLRIIEDETSTLGFKSRTYRLKRLRVADDALKPFERELMDGLFGTEEEAALKDRRAELVKARKKIEELAYEEMAALGYYASNPQGARTFHFGLAIAVGFLGHLVGVAVAASTGHSFVLFASYATAALIAVFGLMMPKKTEKGALAAEHARGFKLYLEKAETYRIQWQEREGVFENFLPYAMVFGVADKWSKALADVAKEPPGWYVGNFAAWSAVDFSDRVSTFTGAAAAVAAPQSSGGSGGGGFSGGGFGGGGGGSW